MSPCGPFLSKPPQGLSYPWSTGNTQGFRKNSVNIETNTWFVSKMKTSSRTAPMIGWGNDTVDSLLSVHRAMGNSTGHVQLQNGTGTGIYKLKWLITNAAGYVFGIRGAVKNIPRALRKFSGSFRLPQDTVGSTGIKLVRGLLALLGSHNCQAQ